MTIVEEVFSRCSLEELKTILDEYSEVSTSLVRCETDLFMRVSTDRIHSRFPYPVPPASQLPGLIPDIFEIRFQRWGTSIESEILSKFEGAFCKALLLIIKMARNLPLYYAEKMFACVTKTSINHQRLSGLIVSRCEVGP